MLGLAVVFFLVNYGQELLLAHDLSTKSDAQRVANAGLSDENTRLRAMLQYYQSDKYVEQRAREDLNLRRADEEVLIPVGDTQPSHAPGQTQKPSGSGTPASGSAPAATDSPLVNWQKWLKLFVQGP